MNIDIILITIFAFFYQQSGQFFNTNLPIGLGGRLIYVLCFLLYSHHFRRIQSQCDNTPEIYPLNRKFWVNFIIRELIFILIAIPTEFLAVFIAGYSLIAGSKLLCSLPKISEFRLRFLRCMGYLFFPGAYLLGLIGLGYFGLYANLVAALLSYPIFKIMNRGFDSYPTMTHYMHFYHNRRWAQLSKSIKVFGLILCIILPISFVYVFYQRFSPDTYMIEMRDGVQLRTRVYYPPDWDNTPKPVLLCRTPYNTEGMMINALSMALSGPYIVVLQDLRGTPADGSGSKGKFNFFRDEWSDGVDTVDWILAQPWCDGRIGSMGGSALAINQMLYHPEAPAGLKVASITVGTGELYDYVGMIGGCVRLGLLENWLPGVAGQAVYEENVAWLLSHTIKDEAWAKYSLKMNDRYKGVDIRAVHLGGWYDMFCQGSIEGFELYNQGTSYAQNHQILVMGPWYHGFTNEHLDLTYPTNAMDGQTIATSQEQLLFGEYLKNQTVDWDNIPRVYYYVMGDPDGEGSEVSYNHWRNASSWPIPASLEPWYLHPDMLLSPNVPTNAANLSYIYDPTDPVRNGGGTTLTLEYIGAVDQRRVEYNKYFLNDETIPEPFSFANRTDILKFTSAPLTNQLEIIGRLQAELYITSNCTDTDFTAKLIDIYPDGKEMWVAEGILKARSREGYNKSVLMTPGEVYDLNIDMWSTAYRFTEGHRLRLSISSSNWNKFAVNPNTGGAINITHPENLQFDEYFYANNTVLTGISGSLSCLWLPRTN